MSTCVEPPTHLANLDPGAAAQRLPYPALPGDDVLRRSSVSGSSFVDVAAPVSSDGKKADDQKGAKASDAKSSSKAENDGAIESAAAADDGASSTESAPIWPYIVLAVGVAGLAAAIMWFVVARRKRDGDE